MGKTCSKEERSKVQPENLTERDRDVEVTLMKQNTVSPLHLSNSLQGPVVSSFGLSNEYSGFIKEEKILNQLSDHYLLKKYSVPWGWFQVITEMHLQNGIPALTGPRLLLRSEDVEIH